MLMLCFPQDLSSVANDISHWLLAPLSEHGRVARNAVSRGLASASHFFRLSSSIRPLTVETLVDSCLRSHLSQPWVCEDLTLAQLSALRRLCFSHLRSGLHLLVLAPLAKLATPAHTTINQGTKPSSKRRGLQTSREEGNLEIGKMW